MDDKLNNTHKCENCRKEHDGSFGSGRFCSDHCRHSYCGKKTKHHVCNLKDYNTKRKSPYGTWTCTICGKIFETRSILQSHRKTDHNFIYRKTSWNKGKTKETSDIVKQIAEKNKTSMLGKSHHLSKETKEKLSEIRSLAIDSNCSGGFSDVKWYKISNINNQEFTVRGTWELTIAELLNKHGILWIRNKTLKYKLNGIRKTYNPDFYLVNSNEYIEVKGYYSDKDKQKMRLVIDQNNGVRIYMIGQDIFYDFKNEKMWLNESLIMS